MDIDRTEGDVNLSDYRKAWADSHLDEETKQLLEEDAKYFLHQSLSTPCLNGLIACSGSYITDNQGRTYLDFHGNNVHQVGYSNPKVVDAIKKQLDTLSFSPRRYTNRPAVDLAKKLVSLTGNTLQRVLFAPGGTLAMGMALKIARTVTGRFKTISFWESFHGASLDSISVGGESLFRRGIGPLLPGTIQIPFPSSKNGETHSYVESLAYIEYIFKQEGDIAAVISEPIRYTTVTSPPAEYWQGVRALCDKYGALLIFDEIPTALGRSGKMFVHEHFGVTPDLLCLGKGLGGGIFPMAAVLATERCNVNGSIAIGHYTHEKSPIGSVAALATIEYIEEKDLLEGTVEKGEYFRAKLSEIKKHFDFIGDIRVVGLMIAIDIVTDSQTMTPSVEGAEFILYQALSLGLSFKVSSGNVLALMPPLMVSYPDIDESLSILTEAFKRLSEINAVKTGM